MIDPPTPWIEVKTMRSPLCAAAATIGRSRMSVSSRAM